MARRRRNNAPRVRKSGRRILVLCEGKTEKIYIGLLLENFNREQQKALKIEHKTNRTLML